MMVALRKTDVLDAGGATLHRSHMCGMVLFWCGLAVGVACMGRPCAAWSCFGAVWPWTDHWSIDMEAPISGGSVQAAWSGVDVTTFGKHARRPTTGMYVKARSISSMAMVVAPSSEEDSNDERTEAR